MNKLTLNHVKKELYPQGVRVYRDNAGDYVVKHMKNGSTYYTNDLEDAYLTGKDMASSAIRQSEIA